MQHYATRARTIRVSPMMNAANIMVRRRDVPAGAVLNSFQMNVWRAVRSIDPGNIQPGAQERFQNTRLICGRTQGRYDFGAVI